MASFKQIFVYYPRGSKTGGPEALHQLVDSLRRQGADAYLTPYEATRHFPRVEEYDRYQAPEREVEDGEESAVVAPELSFEPLMQLKRAQAYCWWLSVDNAASVRCDPRQSIHEKRGRATVAARTRQLIERRKQRHIVRDLFPKAVHLTQSQYAWSFLQTRYEIVARPLGDYIDLEEHPPSFRESDSKDDSLELRSIAYNPRKAGTFIEEMRAALNPRWKVNWVPLIGYSSREIHSILSQTDIYFDPGNHPGKDRLPREAALAGAVTIVVRRGAAAYRDDVPLPEEHKFDPGARQYEAACSIVTNVLEDLGRARDMQATYRADIISQKEKFDAETRQIFLNM